MKRLLPMLALAGLLLAGGAGAYFEENEVGVRAIGFGQAFTAVADDASTVYWNPAAVAFLDRRQLLFVHSRPYAVEGLASNYLALAMPGRLAGLGFSWHHVGAADIMGEDMFTLALARNVTPGGGQVDLAAGAAVKLARVAFTPYEDPESGESVDHGSETALMMDLSLMARFSHGIRAGAILRNIGSPEFDLVPGEGGDKVPTLFQAGVAYQWNPESIVSLDYQEQNDGDHALNLGGELRFYRAFALRMGVSSDASVGAGASVTGRRLTVDFSVLTNSDLGASYRAGVKFPFGPGDKGNR